METVLFIGNNILSVILFLLFVGTMVAVIAPMFFNYQWKVNKETGDIYPQKWIPAGKNNECGKILLEEICALTVISLLALLLAYYPAWRPVVFIYVLLPLSVIALCARLYRWSNKESVTEEDKDDEGQSFIPN
jgi:ABC-type spermidine/putrescine transport system permease subunit I